MSYHSQHMHHVIKGIRGSVREMHTNIITADYPAGFQGVKDGHMWDYIKDMETFEEFKQDVISFMEYGNTLFNDTWLLVNYFRHGFNLRAAGRGIGYKGGFTNNLTQRLCRVNTDNPALAIQPFIEKGWVTKEAIQSVLNMPKRYKQGERLRS